MGINRPVTIQKILNQNDTGETGSHQAAIHFSRNKVLSFFPHMNSETLNPRVNLPFKDDSGKVWNFSIVFYNNRQFGGTRNEYRLSKIMPFIRLNGLKAGDTLILSRDKSNNYWVSFIRKTENENDSCLKLGNTWKVIRLKK